ncbi:MAG: hypothetical protein QME12_01395 [Nanoarchaeota archaeon]|nr:hypothetical protein [Nanoarchaeota archaeon]
MTNTKAWLGVATAGAACYFLPEAIEYVMNYFGSSTRPTPNSASDLEMLSNVGQWIAAGGAGAAVGSIVGKLGGDNQLRRAGLEGIADFGTLAYIAKTDWFKDMLYKINAYSPGTQSKTQVAALGLCALFTLVFFAGCAGDKKADSKKKKYIPSTSIKL